ncbi:hypothetical protein PMIN01_00090 [Paraphaeosphaeria minitans]|uniref:Uncharacterized protein n=1 Tax=Paraphaeosphaeria minitans TaxID=565426 RepID=A0A9P6GSH9_9PLEO|nr:hypothetical protein PMIN01_00090 [Paraphaeosphaeria minitans]
MEVWKTTHMERRGGESADCGSRAILG